MFTGDPSHLKSADLEALVARTFTFYDDHDRGFEWKTFDHDRGDLRPLLATRGARPEPSEALILGDASALAGDANLPAGLTLRAVTSRADLERVAALESQVWAEDWSWLGGRPGSQTRGHDTGRDSSRRRGGPGRQRGVAGATRRNPRGRSLGR